MAFYSHHGIPCRGTITGYYPAATTPDEYGEMEPEFWQVTIDDTGQVALGYINEFDFLV